MRADERAAVRRVLMYWGNADRARSDKAEQIAETEQQLKGLYDIRPQVLTGMPHGGGISDTTMETALRNIKKAAGLEARIKRLSSEMADLDRIASMVEYEVMCLPPLECEVIRLRYVRFGVAKKGYWSKIAMRIHVSEDHAKTLERHGVEKLIGRIEVNTI